MFETIQKSLVPQSGTIRDAIKAIHEGSKQICLVVNDNGTLLGSVTDGDIRRALLGGATVEMPVAAIMNSSPVSVSSGTSRDRLLEIMQADVIQQLPIVDEFGKIIDIVHIHELITPARNFDNFVVLMAGGLGRRLVPLTERTPKPLLPIGDKPVLEIILENFVRQKFHNIFISVNYKAEAIKNYFGNGKQWNVNFRYLEERQPLGTAGALKLISEETKEPIIVMNADVLTQIIFQDLLNYHKKQAAQATMCVREYDFQVPYGVVDTNQNQIVNINEKPVHRFFVNAGIYVLEQQLIEMIPDDEYFDMTTLFGVIIDNGVRNAAYPIHEYWLDIGRPDDLNRANEEFRESSDL